MKLNSVTSALQVVDEIWGDEFSILHNKAMLLVYRDTGNQKVPYYLRWDNLDLTTGMIRIRYQKRYTVSTETVNALEKYLTCVFGMVTARNVKLLGEVFLHVDVRSGTPRCTFDARSVITALQHQGVNAVLDRCNRHNKHVAKERRETDYIQLCGKKIVELLDEWRKEEADRVFRDSILCSD